METGAITSHIDVAQMVLYAFWIFFAGLVFYLHREDKREGYPIETEGAHVMKFSGFPDMPAPKVYDMPHGGGTRLAPKAEDPQYELDGEPTAPYPGSPLTPKGDGVGSNIGPGSYAIRPETPDLTWDGKPRIQPLRVATAHGLDSRDPDPRGKPVWGADGEQGATVTDVWVDLAEPLIRYLEIDVGGRSAMLPINFCRISKDGVRVQAILGKHFANAPGTANPDQITLQEEDKAAAYFGSGTLYATPERAEPWL